MTKRKTNTGSGVYQYLEASGVLDAGSSEDIAKMRKKYWNERKRISKQEKRKRETEFKIYVTDKELEDIARFAKIHHMSCTNYIKKAAIAYTHKRFLIINQASVNHITQLLSLNYSLLQDMLDGAQTDTANSVLQTMTLLEQEVLAALYTPKEVSPNTIEL